MSEPNVNRIRTLIADIDAADRMFSPEQISDFINMAKDTYRSVASQEFYAAALALRSMAVNAVLVKGKTKQLDVSTDGPAEAKSYNDQAAAYELEAVRNDQKRGKTVIFDVYTPTRG